jgi:hypothetical protein
MSENETQHDPFVSQPRPRWRQRIFLGSLSGLFVVALCLAVPSIYLVYSSDQALREAIAEADRLDPGWRPRELEEKRAVIPDEQNSALVLLRVKGLLPLNWPFWNYPQAAKDENSTKVLALQKKLRAIEPPVQLGLDLTNALRQELQRAEEALGAARLVLNMPKGRYPSSVYRFGIFGSATGMIARDILRIGDLFAYDALVRAQDKDVDGALASCRGILNSARSIGDEPSRWSMLVRVASNQMATRQVERTLAQGEPSEAALAFIQHDLENEAEQPLLLLALQGERGGMDELLQAIQEGEFTARSLEARPSGWYLPPLCEFPTFSA